jgi:HAD superfamily hydrolase (TIGR01549 family)
MTPNNPVRRTPKAVFFDMGSTLSHQDPTREELLSNFLLERGLHRSLQELRRSLLDADTWWHSWTQQNPFGWNDEAKRQSMRLEYRQVFLKALGLDNENHGLREALTDLWTTSIMRRHNAIYPDVLPTLATLRERGLKLAIVSNWDNSLMSHCDDLGLTPLFDTIVGSLYVGYEKPDARIFHVALDRLGVAAAEVVHVGDIYVSDVVGARAAGILPILLDRHDLQPDADCLRVQTLDEVIALL